MGLTLEQTNSRAEHLRGPGAAGHCGCGVDPGVGDARAPARDCPAMGTGKLDVGITARPRLEDHR